MKKWITYSTALCITFFIGHTLFNTYKESKETASVHINQGVQATDFILPLLDGEKMTLQEHKGKIVILNFWASWCEPCNMEMPHLQDFYEEHQDDVEILAVNATNKDRVTEVKKFRNKYQLTFPILLDESGETSTVFGAFSFPTTIIIDRQGNIVQEVLGPMEKDLLEDVISTLN